MAFYEEIVGRVRLIQERFHSFSAEEKRRFLIICAAALSLLLIITVIISISTHYREKKSAENKRAVILTPIPPEELFLPDEPDFLPEVILERDRRLDWTEQDASQYWQDPLMYGEEQWREKIEAAVDEMLERVP